MKIKDCAILETENRKLRPLLNGGIQIIPPEMPIGTYPQNEELSSKVKDILGIAEAFLLQLHCSNPGDILAQIVFVPKEVEIAEEHLVYEQRGYSDISGERGAKWDFVGSGLWLHCTCIRKR